MAPLVSIGLPVYNGERFLPQALDSLLGQTLTDLELIISDNASTDSTAEICREYAASDARVRYIRQEANFGPQRNWNFVAGQARGRYFKWATANDFCERQMLEKCVAALSADASIVVCHSRTCMVDEQTGEHKLYQRDVSATHPRPSERFKSVVYAHALNNALNGVIRIDVLRRTPLIRPYLGGDVVLTAELALHGSIVLLPEVLFFRRMGPETSSILLKPAELQKFYYPPASGAKPGREQWRRHADFLQTILRTPIAPAEKRLALLAAARHAVRDRLLLLEFLPAPARHAARYLVEASPHRSGTAPLLNSAIPWINSLLGTLLPYYVHFRWKHQSPPRRPHRLPGRLIVSLTSYPARFPTLPLTLKCLLSQSVAADEVILWIAKADKGRLTSEILSLCDDGLTIKLCDEDLGPYTKIVPALMDYPEAYVATADDDAYYGPTWLEQLVGSYRSDGEVLCHRAHRIRTGVDGLPLAYQRWDMNTAHSRPSSLIFATGHGGVLYPPGALHPDVTNVRLFREICASADDVWLYWMMRRNGTHARKVGPRRLLSPTWRKTQRVALWKSNVFSGGNDKYVRAMSARFGFPPTTDNALSSTAGGSKGEQAVYLRRQAGMSAPPHLAAVKDRSPS